MQPKEISKGENYELNPEKNEKFNFINSTLCEKLKTQKLTFKLLYKATRDGDSEDEFHSKCDNINNALIIIKTKENNIIGGFTTALLNCINEYNYDDYAFLFSINNNKIYNLKSNQVYAVGSYKGSCLLFGVANGYLKELLLSNKFLSNYKSYTYNGGTYFDKNDPPFILNNGNRNFLVKECEIYQVIPDFNK